MRLVQQSMLLGVMIRMMRAGAVAPGDRGALARAYREQGLTVADAREVYRALLRGTWGDVIDDDLLSPEECAILAIIVDALGLPPSYLPERRDYAIAL